MPSTQYVVVLYLSGRPRLLTSLVEGTWGPNARGGEFVRNYCIGVSFVAPSLVLRTLSSRGVTCEWVTFAIALHADGAVVQELDGR